MLLYIALAICGKQGEKLVRLLDHPRLLYNSEAGSLNTKRGRTTLGRDGGHSQR